MSASTHTNSDYPLAAVQFSRLTKRGIMLGLSLPQLIVLGVAVLTVVFALYLGGGMAFAWTAPIWATCALLAVVPAGGRKVIEWVPILARWIARTYLGQLIYRRRVIKPRPAGTLALPGDAAPLREWEEPETGAAMIHDPHAQTLTAILGVSHPAFVLLDPGEQQRRVSGWGRVLAAACRSGRIARIQVSERTLPDSGTGLAEWWRTHGTDDGSWAATTYAELIERAGPAGERHATTISLALDMKAASRQIRTSGGGIRGAAAVLRQEMTTLTTALRAAELASTGWLTPGEVAVILRSAYDPAAAPALERHGDLGRDLATAGPVAVTETWTGCGRTPRTTRCCGSPNGPAPRSTQGSLPRSCCPTASSACSPCTTRPCAPIRPHGTCGRRRPSSSPTPRSGARSGRSKTPPRPRSWTTCCNRKQI